MFTAPASSPDHSALPAALHWIEGLLLGSVGSAVAVIAVALTGFAMLFRRLSVRSGARVIVGGFIPVWADTTPPGVVGLVAVQVPAVLVYQQPAPAPAQLPPPSTSANPFDPYAGASVPMDH